MVTHLAQDAAVVEVEVCLECFPRKSRYLCELLMQKKNALRHLQTELIIRQRRWQHQHFLLSFVLYGTK